MRFKLKKNSSIRTNGLYDLEEILGECDGHGVGFGGEDIDWEISKNEKLHNILDIHEEGGFIYIRYLKFYDDIEKEPTDIGLGKLPKELLERVQEVVARHCSNKIKNIGVPKRNVS